jgi:hypothetical protein
MTALHPVVPMTSSSHARCSLRFAQLGCVIGFQHALGCLGAPDLEQIRSCPIEIKLLGPHEDEWMNLVMRGDEERVRLGLDQDFALLKRHLKYRCVLVRAPGGECGPSKGR